MNKHTEGPWLILPEEPNIPYIRIRGSQLGRRYKIANVHADRESDLPETRANARLIAAAPQMLEALEAVAPLLHWLDQEQNVTMAGDMLPKVLAAIKAALSAAERVTK